MKYAKLLSLITGIGLFANAEAFAEPVLLTICETENGQTQAWWPSDAGLDIDWQNAFIAQGVSLIHPNEIPNASRLSPTVYGQKPLSQNNAKTLASLFGAKHVLNGNVSWNCSTIGTQVECAAKTTLSLIYGKKGHIDFNQSVTTSAPNEALAKKYAMTKIVSEMALPIIEHTSAVSEDIPQLINKPVIIFDPIPDADTLVALRKQLKRVPGVEDVAERWVSNGVLAIEINPGVSEMSQADFLLIVQGFMNETTENLVIRETRQTETAAVFEVVKF